MITEASKKANKLHIMHSAKQIGKIKDGEEREREAKDLEKKAKKMGFDSCLLYTSPSPRD